MNLFPGIATDTLFKSPVLQEAQQSLLSSISADLYKMPVMMKNMSATYSAISADLVRIPAAAESLSAQYAALGEKLRTFPTVADAQQSAFASVSADLYQIPDVMGNLSAQVMAPLISAAAAKTDFAARVSGIWRSSDELRALFTRIIAFRRRVSSRLADLRRPAKVEGLQQNLDPFRHRLASVAVESISHAHMRAMLARRERADEAPGKLLTTRPQIARGPNTRRSIRTSQSPAGLLHV